MTSQTKNNLLWSKLFVTLGVSGIHAKTNVTLLIIYKIKKEQNYIPTPLIQRKLSRGLNIPLEELFPFRTSEPQAA